MHLFCVPASSLPPVPETVEVKDLGIWDPSQLFQFLAPWEIQMRTQPYFQSLWVSFYLIHVLLNGFAQKELSFLPASDGGPPSPALWFSRSPQAISLRSVTGRGRSFGGPEHSVGWWNAAWSLPIQTQSTSKAGGDDILAWGGRSTQGSGRLCNKGKRRRCARMWRESIPGVGLVLWGRLTARKVI